MLNRHLLLSAIEAPKAIFDGQPLHTSLAEVAAGYAFGIARNHPFVGGNKRTALMTAWTFVDTHGYRIVLNDAWKDLMVRVANERHFDRGELVRARAGQMAFNDPID